MKKKINIKKLVKTKHFLNVSHLFIIFIVPSFDDKYKNVAAHIETRRDIRAYDVIRFGTQKKILVNTLLII